ncbi:metallophosphoesterase [Methylomagnum ishizawai]|uniref:metallophosphoesterase n=1 Tax=Methylomagnum ishizawai TaxID=1760988 RepID=UPI001C333C0F|nr:metallophosphoesterase [Methylomagnum ishizawai]BBL75325.1 serine/threonine protein phosphatase [Methylomagnum ishizawai]
MNLEEATFRRNNGIRLVKRLPANRAGRDFVVGDLHGCRKELDRLLLLVKFDRGVDRLISVGDLVDRGPYSLDCLSLLKAPWFHAVMGNHEQLMLNFFAPWLKDGSSADPYDDTGLSFLVNGGNWALHECDSRWRPVQPLRELLELVIALPQILVVGEGGNRYNVVHAELVAPRSREQKPEVWSDADIDALPDYSPVQADYPALRWSRQFMGANRRHHGFPAKVPELSQTFCGHTVGLGVRTALSHVCLDTGAFLLHRQDTPKENYGLTLLDVREGRYMTLRDYYLEDGDL